MFVLIGVVVALTLLLLALTVLLAWQLAAKLSIAAAVVTLVVFGFLILLVLVLVLIVVNAVLLPSMVFAVTAQGLTLATPYRRAQFVPWAQVAAIEPSQGLLLRGAVVIVLADGTRLTASPTNASARYAHPPTPPQLGPGTGAPVPLRAALDGLARSRRGEFADTSLRAPGPPAASNGAAVRPPAG